LGKHILDKILSISGAGFIMTILVTSPFIPTWQFHFVVINHVLNLVVPFY